MNKSFVFMASYFEAIQGQKTQKERLLLYEAVCKYGIEGKEPNTLPAHLNSIFVLIRPNIDSSIKRYKASVSNGFNGGAPEGNQNARKQPKNNQSEQKKQPKNNLDKDKEKDFDKDLYKDVDRECDSDSVNVTHTHGKYTNVLLSDSELEKLQGEFYNWQDLIEKLSEYMASTGKTYNNHYATLCKWAKEDAEKAKKLQKSQIGKSSKAEELDDFYKMADAWANGKKTQKINREDYYSGDQVPW